MKKLIILFVAVCITLMTCCSIESKEQPKETSEATKTLANESVQQENGCILNDTIFKELYYGMIPEVCTKAIMQDGFNTLKVDDNVFNFEANPLYTGSGLCGLELKYIENHDLHSYKYLHRDSILKALEMVNSDQAKLLSWNRFMEEKQNALISSNTPNKLKNVLDLYSNKYGPSVFDNSLLKENEDYASGGKYTWRCSGFTIEILYIVKRIRVHETYSKKEEAFDALDKFEIHYYKDAELSKYVHERDQTFKNEKKRLEEKQRLKKQGELKNI